mmetsp:Transcript_103095/g.188130  ORF Transcript_103095/g.188130 Transcript_103095/m.188130 type:complete len:522 (-) Transcript_103095:112-1677(-)
MNEDDEKVAEIVYKIQVYTFPRRIRIREFFLDFDPLKCGRCTRIQFGRGLDMAGLKMSYNDKEFLVEYFTESGPHVRFPQVVSYDKFVKEVDQVFAADEMNDHEMNKRPRPRSALGFGPRRRERDLNLNTSQNSTLRMSMSTFAHKEVEDEDRVMHVMHRLASLCKFRGVVFKQCYTDLDRGSSPSPSNMNARRGGKVNLSLFRRYFPFRKEISPEDVDLLARRYSTDAGDVHFVQLHNDISEVLDPKPPPFPSSPLHLRPDNTQWDHTTLNPVKKIQSRVVERRVRLRDLFLDFDHLRKGYCTLGQLKTVLTVLGLDKEVNKSDFEHLSETYCRSDGLFCYATFVSDVDEAFTTPGLEKDPRATVSMPDATSTAAARRNRMTMTANKRIQFEKLEDRLRAKVTRRRILLLPTFKDMDRTNNGHITRNQFARVMCMLGWDLRPAEINLLCAMYCDLGNHDEFNYVDFIKSIDPHDEDTETALAQMALPYQDMAPSKYFNTCGLKVHPMNRRSLSTPVIAAR